MNTDDNIFVLHRIITHMLDAGKRFYCAFVDLSKSFDYVPSVPKHMKRFESLITFGSTKVCWLLILLINVNYIEVI